MYQQHHRSLMHLLPIACCLLAVTLLAGCGGGSGMSPSSPSSLSSQSSPSSQSVLLAQSSTKALACNAEQDNLPVGNATVQVINAQTGTDVEDVQLESTNPPTDSTGQITWAFQGLHFTCSWDGNTSTSSYQRILTVTGTSSEGVTVDLTRTLTWDKSTDTRTLTLVGTVVKGNNTYALNISRQRTTTGTVNTLVINSTITLNGATIYARQITRTVDMSTPQPRVHTVTGTVSYHDANAPGNFVTITYNSAQYTWNSQQQCRVFTAGSADVTDAAGDTAHLTVQNGTLTGPLLNTQGATIGTVTIGNGQTGITS